MRVSIALSIPFLLACPRSEVSSEHEPAAAILVTPDVLVLPAGSKEQLVAQVNDSAGRPIGGAEIRFGTNETEILSVTERGAVSALGPVGGGRILVTSGTVQAEVRVTVVPGAPFQLEKLAGDSQSGRVASALPGTLVARVRDASGNPIPGIDASFEPSQEGSADPPEAVSRLDGSVESRWSLGPKAGEQTLEVGVRAAEREVSTSFAALAEAGPSRSIAKLSGDPANIVAGSTIEAVRVAVTDALGNPKADVEVVWRVLAGGGAVSHSVSTTDVSGIAQVSWYTGTSIGLNQLEARAEGLPRQNAIFAVETLAGAPARLVAIAGESQTGQPGEVLGEAPRLQVVDANGNPVPAVVIRFRVSAGDGSIANPVAMSDEAGVVRGEGWKLGSEELSTLEATVEGVAEPLRFTARVEPP